MADIKETIGDPSYLEGNARSEGQKSTTAITQKAGEVKETKPVVQGKMTRKKQPAGKRLRESLGLEETRTVGDYLVWDVLIPAAKEMVADLVKKGIDVFLYGGTQAGSGYSSRSAGRNKSHVSYNGYYSKNRDYDYGERRRSRYSGGRFDSREFVFDDRRDPELVLSELCEIISVYGFAKVSDFYSLVGETERNFTNHNYGWENLSTATVMRVQDGWVVDLPNPMPLN